MLKNVRNKIQDGIYLPIDFIVRKYKTNIDISRFAQENDLIFLETSAKTGDSVEEAFLKCSKTILAKIETGELDPERIGSGKKIQQTKLIHSADSINDNNIVITTQKLLHCNVVKSFNGTYEVLNLSGIQYGESLLRRNQQANQRRTPDCNNLPCKF